MIMNTQEKTRIKFSNALTELLKSKPFNKITVTDIARQCNVTRQIFYRYFEDKSDLIAYIYEKTFEQAAISHPVFVWDSFILCFIQVIYERKDFYQYAVASDPNPVLYNIFYHKTFQMYRNIIEYRTKSPIDSDTEFLLELYCRGGISLLIKWIGTGMSIPCDKLKDLFLEGMPPSIRNLITNYDIPLAAIYPNLNTYQSLIHP